MMVGGSLGHFGGWVVVAVDVVDVWVGKGAQGVVFSMAVAQRYHYRYLYS